MSRPRIVVTGASGFVGRHVLDALKEDWRIFGLARRSQARSGAPMHHFSAPSRYISLTLAVSSSVSTDFDIHSPFLTARRLSKRG